MADNWKCGNEFLPFHPQASHVEPAFRDGWNACYSASIRAALQAGYQPTEVPAYGSTDLADGITVAGLTLTDGDKRLVALVMTALGVRHSAMDDLVALLMAARTRGVNPCEGSNP